MLINVHVDHLGWKLLDPEIMPIDDARTNAHIFWGFEEKKEFGVRTRR